MRKLRRAFSLVEVIVAIGIILVLFALLLPVLSKAGRRATDTVCIRNLQQIYAAYQLYMADNDDVWPVVQPIHPPMLTYTKGVVFKCTACQRLHPDWPSNVPHYLNVGATIPNRDRSLREARAACEALRGPQLPVLLDKNHRGDRARMAFGEEWVFVTRKDGSTTRVRPLPYDWRGVIGDVPCDRRLDNLNY